MNNVVREEGTRKERDLKGGRKGDARGRGGGAGRGVNGGFTQTLWIGVFGGDESFGFAIVRFYWATDCMRTCGVVLSYEV